MASPVTNQRRACRAPMARATNGTDGGRAQPEAHFGQARTVAVSAASTTSQHASRPTAPPNALPCTTATVGSGRPVERVQHPQHGLPHPPRSPRSEARALDRIQARSAPAEKLGPVLASTSARAARRSLESLRQRQDEVAVERVVAFRPVERQGDDPVRVGHLEQAVPS